MNEVMLLAIALGMPLLVMLIVAIRRLAADKPSMMFDLAGKTLLYAVPLLGALGMLALAVIGSWNLLMLSIYLVVAVIAGPVAFLWYRKKEHAESSLDAGASRLLFALYLIGYAISVLVLSLSPIRPYLYYAIIAIIATLLMLQITLFDAQRRNTRAILLQISLLALNIIWGMSLKEYYYVGRTDILAHAWYVENILQYGFVTPAFGDYQPFPLWHILSGALYMITGASSPVWDLMFLVTGIVYALIPPGIYLIVLRVTGERRIALLSSLFTSFSPFFTLMGSEAMARSIGSGLGIVLLLLLLDGKSKTKWALALFLTLGIIVFHTVGIMYILIILFIAYLAQVTFATGEKSPFLSLKFFIAALALVVAYWSLFAGALIDTLAYSVSHLGPGVSANTMTKVISAPASELFNYLQYTPFLFFIIIGIIFLVRSEKMGNVAKIFGITALALIPLTFPGPAIMLNKLMVEVELDRFFENGFLFMGLAAGAGFFTMFSRSGRVMKAVWTLLFAAMVLLSVSNDFVATDNPLVKRPFYTHYLTSGETDGAARVAELAPGNVMTDFVAYKYLFNSPAADKSFRAQVSAQDLKFLKGNPDDLFLIRDRELNGRPLYLYGMAEGEFQPEPKEANTTYYPKESALWYDLSNYDRVVDSNAFEVYH